MQEKMSGVKKKKKGSTRETVKNKKKKEVDGDDGSVKGRGYQYPVAPHPRPHQTFEGVVHPGFSGGPVLTLPGMVTLLKGSPPQSPHGAHASTEGTSAAQIPGVNPWANPMP